jgi:hypothetical protein
MAALAHCGLEIKPVRCPAVNSTRAESMFERHSTEQTNQAQTPTSGKIKAELTESF